MIQSWENLVTARRTDSGQTDESDFIGCCPTNVERSKSFWSHIIYDQANTFISNQKLEPIMSAISQYQPALTITGATNQNSAANFLKQELGFESFKQWRSSKSFAYF